MINLNEILARGSYACSCGKQHYTSVEDIIIEENAIEKVTDILEKYNCKHPFLIFDKNTKKVAGDRLINILKSKSINFSSFMLIGEKITPDENAIGQIAYNFDINCDIIIGVGSGTVNDLSKVIAHLSGKKYIIVGTAPSMDGFAASTSSIVANGVKRSINSKMPNAIICDTKIMANAPEKMLVAGLGDMLAKYISITDWRIANIVNNEYYCEHVANMVRMALKKCVEAADGLLKREQKAVGTVTEGLILSGIAASYANSSRPASGLEHYFSHIWDMRKIEFNEPSALHGIQCGYGTYLALQVYEYVKTIVPSFEKGEKYITSFNIEEWNAFLMEFLGKSAVPLIELEKTEQKYEAKKAIVRLKSILLHWAEITDIMSEELPSLKNFEVLIKKLNLPTKPEDLGYDIKNINCTFRAAKDIRDKYTVAQLLWDLGMLDECADKLFNSK